jgi:PKD repeat protein
LSRWNDQRGRRLYHLFRGIAAIGLALLGFGFERTAAPTAAFTIAPSNPAAGVPVQLTDTSTGSPTSWKWDFGDGQTSTSPDPTHVYAAAGTYSLSLTAGSSGGQTVAAATVVVSEEGTLRLNASHSFEVTLEARDPRTGNTGTGRAIPQNDVFGYFTIPTLVPTSGPLVPEVFVKILDATAIGQNYWVFWGGLTDLDYTLRVTETSTGATKEYHNPVTGSPSCLGADTSGFGTSPTVTPSGVSPTATRTEVPPIFTFTPSQTPTRTPTTTPTRTTQAVVDVQLQALSWQWSFLAGEEISNDTNPAWADLNNDITLHVGRTYRFDVFNGNPQLDPPLSSHTFSGVSGIGLNGGPIAPGEHLTTQTITISSGMVGSYSFMCTDSACGTSSQHDQMGGRIIVSN